MIKVKRLAGGKLGLAKGGTPQDKKKSINLPEVGVVGMRNDPAYQAYQDSLNLYNKSYNLMKDWSKGSTMTINPTDPLYNNYRTDNRNEPLTVTYGGYPFTGRTIPINTLKPSEQEYVRGMLSDIWGEDANKIQNVYDENKSDVPAAAFTKPTNPISLNRSNMTPIKPTSQSTTLRTRPFNKPTFPSKPIDNNIYGMADAASWGDSKKNIGYYDIGEGRVNTSMGDLDNISEESRKALFNILSPNMNNRFNENNRILKSKQKLANGGIVMNQQPIRRNQTINKLSWGGVAASAGAAALSGAAAGSVFPGPGTLIGAGVGFLSSAIPGIIGEVQGNKADQEVKDNINKQNQINADTQYAMRSANFNKMGNRQHTYFMATGGKIPKLQSGGATKTKIKYKPTTTVPSVQTPQATTSFWEDIKNNYLTPNSIARQAAATPETFNKFVDAMAKPFTQMGWNNGVSPASSEYWKNIGDAWKDVGILDKKEQDNVYKNLPYEATNAALTIAAPTAGKIASRTMSTAGSGLKAMPETAAWANKVLGNSVRGIAKGTRAVGRGLGYVVNPEGSGIKAKDIANFADDFNTAIGRTSNYSKKYTPKYANPGKEVPSAMKGKLQNYKFEPNVNPKNYDILNKATKNNTISYKPNKSVVNTINDVDTQLTNYWNTNRYKLPGYTANEFLSLLKGNKALYDRTIKEANINMVPKLATGGTVINLGNGIKQVKAYTPGEDTVPHKISNQKVMLDNGEYLLDDKVVISKKLGEVDLMNKLSKTMPLKQLKDIMKKRAIGIQSKLNSSTNKLVVGGDTDPDGDKYLYNNALGFPIGNYTDEEASRYKIPMAQSVSQPNYPYPIGESIQQPLPNVTSLPKENTVSTKTNSRLPMTNGFRVDPTDMRTLTPTNIHGVGDMKQTLNHYGITRDGYPFNSDNFNPNRNIYGILPDSRPKIEGSTIPLSAIDKINKHDKPYIVDTKLKSKLPSNPNKIYSSTDLYAPQPLPSSDVKNIDRVISNADKIKTIANTPVKASTFGEKLKSMDSSKLAGVADLGLAVASGINDSIAAIQMRKNKLPGYRNFNPILKDENAANPIFEQQRSDIRGQGVGVANVIKNNSSSGVTAARLGSLNDRLSNQMSETYGKQREFSARTRNENVDLQNRSLETNVGLANKYSLAQYAKKEEDITNTHNLTRSAIGSLQGVVDYRKKADYQNMTLEALARMYGVTYDPTDDVNTLYAKFQSNRAQLLGRTPKNGTNS